jgi:hypothetical protein
MFLCENHCIAKFKPYVFMSQSTPAKYSAMIDELGYQTALLITIKFMEQSP